MQIPWDIDTTTRQLEENPSINRRSVIRAEFISQDTQGILMRTQAAYFTNPWEHNSEGSFEGRLRLDLVTETSLRIRYCEGDQIPENPAPMLVGFPDLEVNFTVKEFTGDDTRPYLEIRTKMMMIKIGLSPYRLKIFNSNGVFIAGIGGLPKGNNLDSFNTGLCQDEHTSQLLAVETFDLRSGESIYGFGERFTNLNKVGQRVDLNASDTVSTSSPRAYKNIPFFVSSHGYGVFINHTCRMSFWIGSLSSCDIQAALDDDFLDYFIFIGSIKEVLHAYTGLTGRGELPPRWSFGFWQSRYLSSPEIKEMAHSLRSNDIPCDVLCLDADWMMNDFHVDLEFSQKLFPDPNRTFAELRKQGFRICAWQMPYASGSLFEALSKVDGIVRTPTGEPYHYGTPGSFEGYVVDFTNPEARQIYKEAIRNVLRQGVSVIKADFGEAAPVDGIYYGGKTGKNIHNLYPLLYNQVIYEATKEETGEGLIWGRSTWAGSQRYPLHWGGDPQSNIENIVTELAGGLCFGLSGFQFWSFDIGGFFGTPTDELYLRTLQLGVFVSHSRAHGTGTRELYDFSPDTMRIGREYLNLRYRMIPYIYFSALECIQKSLPMARALVIEYQDDPSTWNIGDEYLFGNDLLVAPILTEEGERTIYFPEGIWTDWWTGERIPGRQWRKIKVGLDTLPLYIREGGVIVLGPEMQYVDEKPADSYEVYVSLFERDGETTTQVFDDGKWFPVVYRAEQGRHQLSIEVLKKPIHIRSFGKGDVEIIRQS